MRANTFDGCLTDPPYGLSFMGRKWDRSVPGSDVWGEVLRVLKPGAFMLAFGGTRTYHRLTCAIEDAGFEVRDCLMWLYGSGFPKSKSCLKPAWEPIILARKRGPMLPLAIDACRIGVTGGVKTSVIGPVPANTNTYGRELSRRKRSTDINAGRWPANVILDEAAAAELDGQSGHGKSTRRVGDRTGKNSQTFGFFAGNQAVVMGHTDSGGASRFFYCAKASPAERGGNTHPTVKPLKLTEHLARLILPPTPNARLIVPFSGSGSEIIGAKRAGWKRVDGIELNPEYIEIAQARSA